jgi:EmrB/QacA subfamily drug resistance transporter
MTTTTTDPVAGRHLQSPRSPRWVLAITSLALFMTTLDNLVVTMALPAIRRSLHASVQSLEWTVNAYTLTFAVLLLTGAALGDRFGRRRMFLTGLAVFTAASAAAALSPGAGMLISARAVQGAGAAIVLPLTLTLLSEATPPQRRGMALGIWSGVSGLGVAIGPLAGGAVVQGLDWHWIFWINVPVGVILLPLARKRLAESRGPSQQLDIPGLALAGAGLLGVTYAVIRGQELGWTSAAILAPMTAGAACLVAFARWEAKTSAPMLPMRFFRSRAFSAANAVSLVMYFGVFGSIFLLAQFLQTAQGYSPLAAGLRTLPWTAMPIVIAPFAGILSDRIGSRPLLAAGLALQATAIAWLAVILSPGVSYTLLVVPFALAGTGMALVFAPASNTVLASVAPTEAGQASGATNAIRELGGVLGIAILASVFSAYGSYATPSSFTAGLTAALPVGAAFLAAGAVIALLIPRPAREPGLDRAGRFLATPPRGEKEEA